jgi:hypothetical protein
MKYIIYVHGFLADALMPFKENYPPPDNSPEFEFIKVTNQSNLQYFLDSFMR